MILGAGQVGATTAENLASEANDITVVDNDLAALRGLEDKLDIRTVYGHAAHPDVLARAGAGEVDMVLAVTSSDETNMVACQVLATLFQTPTKIARIRQPGYLRHTELFGRQAIPVDVIISPEQLVTDYVQKLIEYPGALQMLDFADARLQLVGMRAYEGGPLVGDRLKALREHMPHVDTRVAAIFRGGQPVAPTGETLIRAGDEVFFLSATADVRAVMREFGRLDRPVKRVMIAGGGNIGFRLASALQQRYSVKLMERSEERAAQLAEQLDHTLVLHGNAADEEILESENIGHTDVFCAVTNDEEANILSAMLAKRRGAHLAMSLINRAAYVELVQSGDIDVAISPKLATISSLLSYVRRGDVVRVHSLRRGAAEAIEAVAHGDRQTSRVVGRSIGEIRLPRGCTIGAVVRNDQVIMGHHDIRIEADDHVILFLVDKRDIPQVERLFEVGGRRRLFRHSAA